VTHAWFPPGTTLPSHSHERRVFTVVLEGSFDLTFKRHRLGCTPSTVFTEPGGEVHSNDMGGAGARVIVVQPGNAAELPAECERMLDGIQHFRDGALDTLGRRLARKLTSPDDVSELAVSALAQEMLVLGTRRSGGKTAGGGRPAWLDRVEEMVHGGFLEGLRVSELAQEAGVHPGHLSRVFREHYGVPLGSFIRRLRMEWATDQLLATGKRLSTIAYEAGFTDQSHFTRAFRDAKGVPPGRFREIRSGSKKPAE